MNKRTLKINGKGTILKIVYEGYNGTKQATKTLSIYATIDEDNLVVYSSEIGKFFIPMKEVTK